MTDMSRTCRHGDDVTVCRDCVALTNEQFRAYVAEAQRDRLRAAVEGVRDLIAADGSDAGRAAAVQRLGAALDASAEET